MAIQNLKERVQNIINLPSLPSIAMDIISIIDNPEVNINTLSKIISRDQIFASRVLKVANSPFYSYPKTISTIDFALTVLGFETVKEIIVSIAFTSHFKKYYIKDFDVNKFWAHSIMSSIISRELAKEINYKVRGEAFIAGLIHDVGIFVMSQFFNNEYKALLELLESSNLNLLEAEERVYGATHADIGSWLFERWNFPSQLVESVKNHHSPSITGNNPQLATMLYYTEYLSCSKNINSLPLENSIPFIPDHLPILTFEHFTDLEKFYDKNQDFFKKEDDKVNIFI